MTEQEHTEQTDFEPIVSIHNDSERGSITPEQYVSLMKPLNGTRIAKRSQGGKQLSYLESWDVRAHLIRTFGFGNFDLEMLNYKHVATRPYESSSTPPKPMVEVIYSARMRLTVRDPQGRTIATYIEGAVGNASGPAAMLGEHHDNALKTAASDAMKRCAINLGSQFGLSLYDNGTVREVVRGSLVKPEGWVEPEQEKAPEGAQEALERTLGATPVQPGDDAQTAAQASEEPVEATA